MASNMDFQSSYVEQPDWRPHYCDNTTFLLQSIPRMFETVQLFVKNPENEDFVRGFFVAYRRLYITECNRGEKNGTQTVEETDRALAQPSLTTFSGLNERAFKKTQNLSRAITEVFGNALVAKELKQDFTPQLAKRINATIGEGLFEGGSYRVKDAKPAGFDYYYQRPEEIESEMNSLFERVRRTVVDDNNWFCVAAWFLEKFLKIHPFSNGNGRTARILLSTLLIKHTIVPVFLFHSSNEEYIKCLVEAHQYDNFDLLNSLIIESVFHSLQLFLASLDLYDN